MLARSYQRTCDVHAGGEGVGRRSPEKEQSAIAAAVRP